MKRKQGLIALIFISPWIIGFLLFTIIPLFSSLYFSLTDYNVVSEPVFVGMDNYKQLITNDNNFYQVLGNSLYMIVFGLTFVTIVTFSISILMNDRRVKGLSFFRVVFFIPTLVPLVILSILWIWILQPEVGIVNSILKLFGFRGPGWFASPFWAKPAFILMMVWGSGNMIIIYLAGLQNIPVTLYEAADIDGAGYFSKVINITLPLMRPVILFNVVTGIIKVLQSCAESFIITNGGPDNATNFYALYLYRNAFSYFKMG
jgi:multiple sugar transport system permease protein